MLLPDAQHAEVDIRKLSDYCLDEEHPVGRHKARVFRAALGITVRDAEWFRAQILQMITDAEAVPSKADQHGKRYEADITIVRQGLRAVVRTAWIVAPGGNVPRFISCRVL